MELLIAGGTAFVGRAIAHAAVARGHQVTVLNRGRTPSDLPATVERLVGDRMADLSALEGRHFDATIDTIAYRPVEVDALADALAGRGGHHLQISSISAYGDGGPMLGTEETLSLSTVPVSDDAAVTGETYGPLKAACERRAIERFGADATVVRPTYVVGSHDATYRFPYWVARLQRGGRVLVPGPQASLLQWIDARDLAEFTLGLLEQQLAGAFHVAGPTPALPFRAVIEQMASIIAPEETELVVADGQRLLDHGLAPGALPLWAGPDAESVMNVDPAKALAAGLSFRTLDDTVDDVAGWLEGQPWRDQWMSPTDEAALIAACA